MGKTGETDNTDDIHPTTGDKAAAALVSLIWIALTGGGEIVLGLAALVTGNSKAPVESVAALAGTFLASVLIYILILKVIGWYHGRD